MNAARVFALQAQRIGSPDGISGGITEVDQATAAGLCAGMRRECYLAGRLKWAGDSSVAEELEKILFLFAIDVSNKEHWNMPKGRKMLKKMASLAITEMMEPGKYKEDSIKADCLEIHKSNFSRTWGKRYNVIFQELDDMANRAFSHIMIRQRYGRD